MSLWSAAGTLLAGGTVAQIPCAGAECTRVRPRTKQNVYMHITVPQSPVAPAPAVSPAPAPAVSVASSAAAGHCACQQRTKRKRSERVGRSGRKVHTAADCYGASSRADVFGSCSAGLLAERAMQER